MPIWIKIVFFCWFGLTPVGFIAFCIWCMNNPLDAMVDRYPIWAIIFAILFIADVIMILPVMFWFIFLR